LRAKPLATCDGYDWCKLQWRKRNGSKRNVTKGFDQWLTGVQIVCQVPVGTGTCASEANWELKSLYLEGESSAHMPWHMSGTCKPSLDWAAMVC
jgi:hypothetical protein